jgi:hypothetical protein
VGTFAVSGNILVFVIVSAFTKRPPADHASKFVAPLTNNS